MPDRVPVDVSHARTLARYARACIRAALGGPPPEVPRGTPFDEPGATFVSLHWPDGRLQGCIGTLEPRHALAEDVAKNARAAAFQDPRAIALELERVDALEVEVSILSPLEQIPGGDEPAVQAALRPGIDGVVLAWGGRRATFIPQMWEHLRDPATFLIELKLKAGLSPDFWAPDVEVSRYTVTSAIDPPRE